MFGEAARPQSLSALLASLSALEEDFPPILELDLDPVQELAGTPVGGNDLLIAAQALSLGYTVVTDNGRELAARARALTTRHQAESSSP